MLTITLQTDIEKSLKAEAKRRETTVDRLVNDWLKEYLWRCTVKSRKNLPVFRNNMPNCTRSMRGNILQCEMG